MATVTPAPDLSADLAEARTMLAETRAILDGIVPLLLSAKREGFREGLDAARPRPSLTLLPGGLAEGGAA